VTGGFPAIRWARQAPVVRRADGRPDVTAHHVLLALATFADKAGRAHPSPLSLAKATLLAEDTVDDALGRLTAAGLIAAGEPFGGTGSIVWTLAMDTARDSALDLHGDRRERARQKTAERARRYRERRHTLVDSDVTVSDTVNHGAAERDVTVPEGVITDNVTVSETVSHGVGVRDITVSDTVYHGPTTVITAGQEPRTPLELQLNSIRTPSAPKPARRSRKRYDYTPGFEAFWSAFGRHGDKSEAFSEWIAATTRASPAVIMAAVAPYVASRPDLSFRKGAQRWLQNDCWESAVVARSPTRDGHQPYQNPADQSAYDDPI
jgi:hypothetical protein